MSRGIECRIGDPLILGCEVWDFYYDAGSDCYVARRRGDEDRPVVCVDQEQLRKRIEALHKEK